MYSVMGMTLLATRKLAWWSVLLFLIKVLLFLIKVIIKNRRSERASHPCHEVFEIKWPQPMHSGIPKLGSLKNWLDEVCYHVRFKSSLKIVEANAQVILPWSFWSLNDRNQCIPAFPNSIHLTRASFLNTVLHSKRQIDCVFWHIMCQFWMIKILNQHL